MSLFFSKIARATSAAVAPTYGDSANTDERAMTFSTSEAGSMFLADRNGESFRVSLPSFLQAP